MDNILKNFIFNGEIMIFCQYDAESGIAKIANNYEYKLRNYGNVIFNANENGIPLIEIGCKIHDKPLDEIFDPLLTLVMGDVGNGYKNILYFCNNDGNSYVELALYDNLFAEEYKALLPGLSEYREGKDLSTQTIESLNSLFTAALGLIQDKIAYIKKE